MSLTLDECAGCGQPMTSQPTCVFCGEPMCDDCTVFVRGGIYGHAACAEEDWQRRAALRERIIELLADMPLQRLRRIDELTCYLSPDSATRALRERQLLREAAALAEQQPQQAQPQQSQPQQAQPS